MTIDLRDFDRHQMLDPDTLQPFDADVADYIRASLCRQRYQREQAARETAPPPATEAHR